MKMILTVLAFLVALASEATAAEPVPDDAIAGLKQAKQLVRIHGDRVWPGLRRAPFGFLFVSGHDEILLCDNRLPEGFVKTARSRALDCDAAIGPKTWRQPTFLAAMPAFGPPSVIVMGSPADTGKSIDAWSLTVVHEHFHQWQSDLPDYYQQVDALELSGGDPTGMWMLNYPFPYSNETVAARFELASHALLAAISARGSSELRTKTENYLKARALLRDTVSANDWRYFEFQLWQEGVARWTEISIGLLSHSRSFSTESKILRAGIVHDLQIPDLKANGRVSVYSFGAGEALLLDRINPNWRQCYASQLALGPLLEAKCTRGRLIKLL